MNDVTTFDVHQHLWPEAFVDALRARNEPPFLTGHELVTREGRFPVDLGVHAPETRRRALDEDGIDTAVLSLQPSLGLGALPEDEREALEENWAEATRALVAAGDGRFLALSPGRCREGFSGVSVGAGDLVDLDRLAPVLDDVVRSDTFLFVHPDLGDPAEPTRPLWWQWATGYTSQMQAAYLWWLASGRERWPTLRVLFAILGGGGPFQLERLARRGLNVRSALDPNVFFDVASYGRRAIELCIETFGVQQLVYGSDRPVLDPGDTLYAVRSFGDAVVNVLQTEAPRALLR